MNLRTKILVLVIPIVVLPLIWLGWVAYAKLETNSRQNSLAQMTTMLDHLEYSVQSYLATSKANVDLFSGSQLFRKYVLTADESERYALMQPPLMRLFASYQRAYPHYYELRILLPDGYEDTRSTLSPLTNITEEEWDSEFFKLAANSQEQINTSFQTNPDSGSPALYVTKKLILRDQSFEPIGTPPKLRGYLVTTASLGFIADHIAEHSIGNHGFMFLTDRSNKVLISPQRATSNSAISNMAKQVVRRDSLPNSITKTNYLDEEIYISSRLLGDNLRLFAILPQSDVLASSRSLGNIVILLTFASIVIASLLLYLAVNRMLIKPVHELQRLTHQVGKGDFESKTSIRSNDEIGELARSFEEMSTNLQESRDRISYLAYHDSLTGLPNRHMLQEYIGRVLGQVNRMEQKLGLLYVDLDDFKKVNDNLGHHAGDLLLEEMAERLSTCVRAEEYLTYDPGIRATDTIARVGGDEFIILLPDITDGNEAASIADRILKALQTPFILENKEFYVGASIGISLYPIDGSEADILIKHADMAMYHAKETGRNNYQFFHTSMNESALERHTLENALRKALNSNQFELNYQPKLDMQSGKVRAVEALIRWNHPDLGLLPPSKFIPIAEESGLIVAIGEWVLDKATRQVNAWRADGIELNISVNISTIQLNKQDIAKTLGFYINKNNCPADALEIELTETSIMDNHDRAINILNAVKSLGIVISMDDFGTGYSSFNYLRNLPIDSLKIDKSFISNIAKSDNDVAIVSAILAMAHTLGISVIAEGVETIEQLKLLHENLCDQAQGYLISKPLNENDLIQFLGLFDEKTNTDQGADSSDIFTKRDYIEIIRGGIRH